MTFDATSRELCTVRRVRTNTPLQALTLLNDEAYFEAARALAARMLREAPTAGRTGPALDAARASYAFRLVATRDAEAGRRSSGSSRRTTQQLERVPHRRSRGGRRAA